MKNFKVAKRYARALAGLTPDQAQLEKWGAELERLGRIIEAPEIAMRFAAPEIAPAAKIEALAKIGEKIDLSFPVRSFVAVVARHGRIRDLPAIAEAYQGMIDTMMSRVRASLTFAMPPSDGELARVIEGLQAIAGKTIIPTITVDSSLLGGVMAELEGKIYDGSLVTRLAEVQRRLAG